MSPQFLTPDGKSVEVPVAPATGVYLDPSGVPRHVHEGDPVPPGWVPAEPEPEPEAKPSGKGRKKAPAKADEGQ